MKTLHLSATRPADIRRAAAILKRGGLVAFATETVYGLGADAFNPRAILKVFRAKKRPTFDPLIVHIANRRQLNDVARDVPALARRLASRFWPGPLTLVLSKSNRVPDVVTSGLSTVAVRMPSHPTARKLLNAFGSPIAAPSANRFGHTSPTTAADVREDLTGRIDAVLDGGAANIGIESTIVWPREKEMILLRPGAVSVEALRRLAPVRLWPRRPGEVRSPGGLPTHYAPRMPMALLRQDWPVELESLERRAARDTRRPRLGLLLFKPRSVRSPLVRVVWVLSRKGDLDEAASNLFRAIRNLDRMPLDAILAAPVPRRGIGLAITDRLEKASSGRRAGPEFYRLVQKNKNGSR